MLETGITICPKKKQKKKKQEPKGKTARVKQGKGGMEVYACSSFSRFSLLPFFLLCILFYFSANAAYACRCQKWFGWSGILSPGNLERNRAPHRNRKTPSMLSEDGETKRQRNAEYACIKLSVDRMTARGISS
jgi:hypothetical protein